MFPDDNTVALMRNVARLFLDSLPFYAMVVDENHNIVIANKKITEAYGVKPEEIEGTYCPKTVHGSDKPIPECPLEKSLFMGGSYAESEFYDEKTGRWYQSIIYPLGVVTRDGRRLFLHFTIDITDKKRAQKLEFEKKVGEDKYRAIFENTVNPVAIVDAGGKILEANPSMVSLLRLNPTGKMVSEVFGEKSEIVDRYFQETVQINEIVTFLAEFRENTLIFNIIPAQIGERTEYLIIGKDITDVVKREKLLQMILSVERELDKFSDLSSLLKSVAESIVSVKDYKGVRVDFVGKETFSLASGELGGHLNEKCRVIKKVLENGEDALSNTEECQQECMVKKAISDGSMLYMAVFSILTNERRGSLAFFSSKPFDEEELKILKMMTSDISLAIKNFELNEVKKMAYRKVEEEIEKIALLIDRIRNPLTVISVYAESCQNDAGKIVLEQVERIRKIIENLDEEWRKSEEFRKHLRSLFD